MNFRVFHDYGSYEGWKVVGDYETIVEAVEAREADLSNGGGTSIIVRLIEITDAYKLAALEKALTKVDATHGR